MSINDLWLNASDPLMLTFTLFNGLRLFSYAPEIAAVARDTNGATAISFITWSIWIGANGSTSAYAWFKLGDPPLSLISAFQATCCATVLALAVCKRVRAARRDVEEVQPLAG
jgi:hypothetical protein